MSRETRITTNSFGTQNLSHFVKCMGRKSVMYVAYFSSGQYNTNVNKLHRIDHPIGYNVTFAPFMLYVTCVINVAPSLNNKVVMNSLESST